MKKRGVLAITIIILVLLTTACANSARETIWDPPIPTPPSYSEDLESETIWDPPIPTPIPPYSEDLEKSESGYAEGTNNYGKKENIYGYTKADAGSINYENFLKLKVGMTWEEVKAILITDGFKTYELKQSGLSAYFYNDERRLTTISVYFSDGGDGLNAASYEDDYGLCIPKADISIDKFKKLTGNMKIEEVKAVLGEDFYKEYFSLNIHGEIREITEKLVWVNGDGEILVWFHLNGDVFDITQLGLSYMPDNQTIYPVLTDKQIMDNFSEIKMGINYDELEKQFNNYIPLLQTSISWEGTADFYEFKRYFDGKFIKAEFSFYNGILYRKDSNFTSLWELMPQVDRANAAKLKQGMTYDEVKDILGVGGYKCTETEPIDYFRNNLWANMAEVKYIWSLGDKDSFVSVALTDAKIENEDDIHIGYSWDY